MPFHVQCKTCRHWVRNPPVYPGTQESPSGRCHRYPGNLVMRFDDWCAEHATRTKPTPHKAPKKGT